MRLQLAVGPAGCHLHLVLSPQMALSLERYLPAMPSGMIVSASGLAPGEADTDLLRPGLVLSILRRMPCPG